MSECMLENSAEYWKARCLESEKESRDWKAHCIKSERKSAALETELKRAKEIIHNLKSTCTELEHSRAEVRQLRHTIKKLVERLNREDGPNTPSSKKVGKGTSGKSKGKGKKKKKGGDTPAKKKRPYHPGATDDRRAAKRNQARFEPCECGGKIFRVTRTNTRNMDEITKALSKVAQYGEVWGTCLECGAPAEGKILEGNEIDLDSGDHSGDAKDSGAGRQTRIPDERSPDAAAPEPPVAGPPDEKVWAKTQSGIRVLCSRATAAMRPGAMPDSAIRKGSVVAASETGGKRQAKIPKKGRMGFVLLNIILVLWHQRVTLGGACNVLDRIYSLSYSPATIMDALTRAAEGLKPFTDDTLKRLYGSAWVGIDETTLYVMGKVRYVWLIRNDTDYYYFVHSRAVDMLKDLFLGYEGTVVCDGYHTKTLFESIQRCWAHILRKTDWWAEIEKTAGNSAAARQFNDAINEIFDTAVTERLKGRGAESHDRVLRKLRGTVGYYKKFPEIKEAVRYVENSMNDCLTFMKTEDVPPTNNVTERGMREVVKQRLIRVVFRTWKGAQTFAALLSVMETCKSRKIDTEELLMKHL